MREYGIENFEMAELEKYKYTENKELNISIIMYKNYKIRPINNKLYKLIISNHKNSKNK